MIIIITENITNNIDRYLHLAKEFVREVIEHEKGCLGMEICTNLNKDNSVVYISKWDKKESFELHCKGEIFSKHIPLLGQYYVSGTDTFLESEIL